MTSPSEEGCCRSSGVQTEALKRGLALEEATAAGGYLEHGFDLVDTGREKMLILNLLHKEIFILDNQENNVPSRLSPQWL